MKAKGLNSRANHRRRVCTLSMVAAVIAAASQSMAATLYVSQSSPNPTPPYSSPETAAHNIQDAVDVSTDGDTVLVEPGDYGLSRQITVTNAIRLQSAAGASQTFLTTLADYIWGLWISNSLAVVDGFSFQSDKQVHSAQGAFVVGATIQNCTFTNYQLGSPSRGAIVTSGGIVSNSIVTYRRGGDGAAVSASDGTLITDSQILGILSNLRGSAIYLTNSHLQNSIISGVSYQSAISGGVAVYAVSSSVVGCAISNNFSLGQGAGAFLQDSFMDRCLVTGNVGGGEGNGGGGIFETNSIVRNSLIASNQVFIYAAEPNSGSLGGGVYMQGGALVNCTVTGNSAQETSSAPGGGGGVFAQSGGITNCIIYFNSLNLDRASTNWLNAGSAIFDHCCTAPAPAGTGNITQDPQFAGMIDANYHLAASSPCIGAGVVQSWMTGAQDLNGNPRTTGQSVDMGAYQFRPLLSIRSSGGNITLSWPSAGSAGFVLEQSSDLAMPQGWAANTATVTDDGARKSVTIPATNHLQFFRLHLP